MSGRRMTLEEMLKAVISGRIKVKKNGKSAKNNGDDLYDQCAQKVQYWQDLARQYYNEGLKLKDLQPLLDDMQENRTSTDLIVELAVRDDDWRQAGREVRIFMDQLRQELMLDDAVACGWSQKAAQALAKEEKKKLKQKQEEKKRVAKRRVEFATQLEKKWHLKKDDRLSQQLCVTLERAQTLKEIVEKKSHKGKIDDAAEVLAFLNDFLTQGLDEKETAQAKQRRAFLEES